VGNSLVRVIIDLADDRETPIAVSTIKANEIRKKLVTGNLPEVLKVDPFRANIKGGAFGDWSNVLTGDL